MGPTVAELRSALREGRTTARALTEAALRRARADPRRLGAWLSLADEEALAAADAVDRRLAEGDEPGPLAGMPVGVKDMICVRGMPATAASRILEGFVSPYDATIVARLRRAGAVIVGKQNQDELGMGSSTERSARFPARNPVDPKRVPGGSSGGSAAAVAAGHVSLSLGTDTGGSIRQPASFCGVFGLRPTYGRVSRLGLIAFASSLDQAGPIARTAADAAELLAVIAGHDPGDATSLPAPVPDYPAELDGRVAGLKIGLPGEYLSAEVEPAVREAFEAAVAALESLGCEIVPLSLPHTAYGVATYQVLATAEASSNLARYDGLRYGRRAAGTRSLEETVARSRGEGFGPEVRRRLALGAFVLSRGYFRAYYDRAQRARTLIRRDFEEAFSRCDLIATPTSPTTAFRLGERTDDPLRMYAADVLTVTPALAGLPCSSQPCGTDPAGLPVGLQLVAPPLEEARLLALAHRLEEVLP